MNRKVLQPIKTPPNITNGFWSIKH